MKSFISYYFFSPLFFLLTFCLSTEASALPYPPDEEAVWTQTSLTSSSVWCLLNFRGNLYAGTGGDGVKVSSDNGATWEDLSDGLTHFHIRAITHHGNDLFVATGGGVHRLRANESSWEAVNEGVTTSFTHSLLSHNKFLYLGTGKLDPRTSVEGEGVFISKNQGNSWSQVSNGMNNKDVRVLAAQGKSIFAATAGGGVFRSDDEGENWMPCSNGIVNLDNRALICNGPFLFVGSMDGPYRSVDRGETWEAIHEGLGSLRSRALAALGTNVYVGTLGEGVYHSSDHGSHWNPMNEGFPSNSWAWALEVKDGYLFVGVEALGVWRFPLFTNQEKA